MGSLDSVGGGLDELSHVIWVRDHRHVAGLNGINVGREVVDEVVLRPGEALLVDVEMGQRGGRMAALGEQAADRFALVQAEGRDVDQADDVRRVGAQSGHDLPAVGVAGDDGGTVLAVQHLPQPGDIIRQRGLRELGRGDGVAAGLQALGSNLYAETAASGSAQVGAAGLEGRGSIRQGSLEGSNVNVVQELVDMIETQRAYEVNSKMISATDEMLRNANQSL